MNFLKSDDVPPVYDPLAIPYNYKYNGKELQETGMYDYGARFYMPDIGRWGVIDPYALLYHNVTPYNYTLNNPIYYKDPDGKRVVSTDKETQEQILAYITEQLGENNGFYFNKKGELGYKNSSLNKLSKGFNDEQKSLANGLKDVVNDKDKTIEVISNKDSNEFTVNYYEPDFVMEKTEDGKERYVMENGVPKREGWRKTDMQADLNTTNTGGALFWAPGKYDNTKQGYAYIAMNISVITSLQIQGEKGQLTVPSASSAFFHEMLDHGLDYIKNGNVDKSGGAGIENVYFHNQALKNVSNGQSPLRISHYDTE
jgi:RHS repeat-associated protein